MLPSHGGRQYWRTLRPRLAAIAGNEDSQGYLANLKLCRVSGTGRPHECRLAGDSGAAHAARKSRLAFRGVLAKSARTPRYLLVAAPRRDLRSAVATEKNLVTRFESSEFVISGYRLGRSVTQLPVSPRSFLNPKMLDLIRRQFIQTIEKTLGERSARSDAQTERL